MVQFYRSMQIDFSDTRGGAKNVRRYTSLYIQIVEIRFRSYRLGPPLSDFVESFWLCDGYASPHLRERILPTGTFRLVFNVRDGERTPLRSTTSRWLGDSLFSNTTARPLFTFDS